MGLNLAKHIKVWELLNICVCNKFYQSSVFEPELENTKKAMLNLKICFSFKCLCKLLLLNVNYAFALCVKEWKKKI